MSWVNAALALSPKRAERDVFLEAQRALGGSTPSPALDIDASAWLRRVEEETQWADLLGLTTSNDALRVRLEQVFMPPSAHLHGDRAPSGELDDPPMSMPLTEAMSAHPFLIIIGEPGSGKTTLLRHVAHHLARAAQGQKGSRAVLGLPPSGDVALPLLIPLQHLASFLADRGDHPLTGDLDDAIVQWAERERVGLPKATLEWALARGRAALLLDGLDEIPDPVSRRRVLLAIGKAAMNVAFAENHGGITITTRSAAYGGTNRLHAPFVEARMLDFGPMDVEGFLDRWIRAAHALPFEGGLEGSPEAKRQLEELRLAMATHESLRALSRTPVLLTAIALVHHYKRRLPAQRAILYDEVVSVLLRRFDHDARYKPPTVRAHLAAVALRMMEASTAAIVLEEEDEEVVLDTVARSVARALLFAEPAPTGISTHDEQLGVGRRARVLIQLVSQPHRFEVRLATRRLLAVFLGRALGVGLVQIGGVGLRQRT